jgi:hypothetical protein
MAAKSWNVGDVLTASDMNVWTVPVAVIKPSNTSRNTTTSVADDPDLVLPLAASSSYDIRMMVFYDGPSTPGTGDIKWTFTLPAGATGTYMAVHQNIAASTAGMYMLNWTDGPNINQTNANSQGTGTGNQLGILFSGLVAVAGTAGNLTFRWAQNTSSGTNTRVFAQSYMVAQRIA